MATPEIVRVLSTLTERERMRRDVAGEVAQPSGKSRLPGGKGYPRTVVFRRPRRKSVPVPLKGGRRG